MNPFKRPKGRSFAGMHTVYFIVSATLLVAVYLLLNLVIDSRMRSYFPTVGNLLQYEEKLKEDSYSVIPFRRFRNCSLIVFDQKGNTVYASNQFIRQTISADMLDIINRYGENRTYEVYSRTQGGTGEYLIMLVRSFGREDAEEGAMESDRSLEKFCLLNSRYVRISGSLFSERGGLNENEFNMIRQYYLRRMTVEKYTYTTVSGEDRTLVFVSPMFTASSWMRIYSTVNHLHLLIIPISILVIAIQAFLFHRKTRRAFTPLTDALNSYKSGKSFSSESIEVPSELNATVDAMDLLLLHLNQSEKEKEALYEEKQRIIADISHDLKTPLTVIGGYAKAFLDGKVPDGREEEYHRLIYRKSRMTRDMIESLLEYSSMEHPDYSANLEIGDIADYTRRFFADRYREIVDARYRLSVNIPERSLFLKYDRKLMQHIFDNILANTMKYTPVGTTFFVKLYQDQEGSAVIILADNGPGIDADTASSIFAPFVTANQSRTGANGTGLGLSIVKKAAELQGGSCSLVFPAEKPYRTEFRLVFPQGKES